jgi:membrane associated rhomboid family serine protease
MAEFVKKITDGNRKLIAFLVAASYAFGALFVVRNYPNSVGLYGAFGGLLVSALGIMTVGNSSEHKSKSKAVIAQAEALATPLPDDAPSGRAG